MSMNGWLKGAAVGSALAFLLDPVSGRRRRAMARDKLVHYGHVTECGARKARVDLQHRVEGKAATLRGKVRGDRPVDDDILIERVRARLGYYVSHMHALTVSASAGTVTMAGPILTHEAARALRCVAHTPGVHELVDRLERHATPEHIAALQGGAPRNRPPELLQQNWAPGIRLVAGTAAGALCLWGMRAGNPLGALATIVGSGVALRALTNQSMKRLLGLGERRPGIVVDKAIHIDVPPEELFSFFRNFQNLPRFMSHLESVGVDGDRSHWVARGPAGVRVRWDGEITRLEPNRLIAWRSTPGSSLVNQGVVRFEPDPRGGSLLSVHMRYEPPAGALGHAVATLFGADPKHALDQDLLRLKSLLESGKATAHHHTVSRDELAPPPRLAPLAASAHQRQQH